MIFLTHPYGCSQVGQDQINTMQVLASLSENPNCGAALILGLGCENNNIEVFKKYLKLDKERIFFLNCQDVEDEIEQGCSLVESILKKINTYKREPCSLSKLSIGLKCGGSDGLSGVTANPLIGKVVDALMSAHASAIMTEIPEMFGAESFIKS